MKQKVAWPRQAVTLTRAQAYGKLLKANSLFQEGAAAKLHVGGEFALTTFNGEKLSGGVEMGQEPRGICLRVKEWNDALFWVTLEGSDGKIDAQIWISTFGLPESRVDELNEVG